MQIYMFIKKTYIHRPPGSLLTQPLGHDHTVTATPEGVLVTVRARPLEGQEVRRVGTTPWGEFRDARYLFGKIL